ncbi:uncharacterized protein LOC126199494 [Schistocerca nitens]|uniref:uncharacterized protein LOC126199494 n=1 Tax=Schistocerca nitens TaxID=7011 RepID=UPI0021195F6A|nr:uncharacterized protein LOC126199494 [Schistocerca nitens]
MSSVFSFLSVWLIVAFTVERFIAVQYPLHRPRVCTVSRAKTIVLGLVGVALPSHIYSFWTAGLVQQDDGTVVCEMLPEYHEIMRAINIVDSLVTLILPVLLIIFMNAMITRKLVHFGRRFRQQSSSGTDASRSVEGVAMVGSNRGAASGGSRQRLFDAERAVEATTKESRVRKRLLKKSTEDKETAGQQDYTVGMF